MATPVSTRTTDPSAQSPQAATKDQDQFSPSGSKRPRIFFASVPNAREGVGYITPNWFASVMGTGIVANAAATLPVQVPGLRQVATLVWLLASSMLLVLIGATLVHWLMRRSVASNHHNHKIIGHFYGALPMALMTVGVGTLLLGQDLIGHNSAVIVHATLWSLGTTIGLFIAAYIPYVQFTRHSVDLSDAFGGWLMPVVSPMVSAATGALLIPEIPEGQLRQTFMVGLYGCFGLTLLASMILIPIIWAKLAVHGVGPDGAVPTYWILLGPLGQSITAVNLLGSHAGITVNAELAGALESFGIIFGVVVSGFAFLWLAIALMITIKTVRTGMPFSLTWWSFTFPVGTVVTGLSVLAAHTGLVIYTALATMLYIGLVYIWVLVWSQTFIATVIRGELLRRPAV